MKSLMIGVSLALGLSVSAPLLISAQQNAPASPAAPIPAGLPDWAYAPPLPPGTPIPSAMPADDATVMSMPGSSKTFTRGELRMLKDTTDWHPEDRQGVMPDIVRVGRQPAVRHCTLCHLPDGSGRPENASLSGLPVAYLLQAMQDYRDGVRRSADPRKNNVMIGYAKALTREEDLAAAQYFSRQPYPRRLKVVESKTAPKVRMQGQGAGMHMAVPAAEGGGMVPIHPDEIVEVPDDNLRAEARDTHLTWTAYVPPGMLNRGKQVASKYQCAMCHGANFEGIGPVPALAGRSPSYAVRQMFDMKTGARRGPWTKMMESIVSRMTPKEMAEVSAFTASIPAPQPATPAAR